MEAVIDWILGQRLTATGRIISALWPMVALFSYFLVGMIAFAIRNAIKGPWEDEEVASRGSTIFAGMWFRQCFAWVMLPVWALLKRSGLPANAMTTLSVLLAIASGVAVAAGRFSLGGWLFIFSGFCDFFDGRIARFTNTASKAGSALDSILDRYSDAAILVGLGWYYRDSWVQFAVMVALVGSLLVPYVRAKGESLGVSVTVGLMPRVERIVYLGVSVALSPIIEAILVPDDPAPMHRLAIAGIVLLAISTQLTAAQRFIFLMQELSGQAQKLKIRLGQGSLFRNVVSAAIATGLDFLTVVMLVTNRDMDPWLATALGCVVGGIANFVINRIWTFASDSPVRAQAARYTFVSATSMFLNSGGVAVILLLPDLDYRLAWILVRVAVFLAWNFPLQRDYVFAWQADKSEVPLK